MSHDVIAVHGASPAAASTLFAAEDLQSRNKLVPALPINSAPLWIGTCLRLVPNSLAAKTRLRVPSRLQQRAGLNRGHFNIPIGSHPAPSRSDPRTAPDRVYDTDRAQPDPPPPAPG
ncbi:uncharacterized protein TrAFT101_006523 [Trichoderma asperellum]|uniref:uncharacterized protein n=1 Tax=Trichoderma asperellum TaxID=101201 RepID=UPI00331FCF7F|nr:hypothetical protein TrAFT101_006523 [Trichoderma asperellum]